MLSRIKQLLLLCLYMAIFVINEMGIGGIRISDIPRVTLDPWVTYGYAGTIYLYTIRVLCVISLPLVISNIIGLLLFNTFKEKTPLKSSPLLGPLLCIRTVTRGDYPDMVAKNVERNIKTCLELGLDNFIVEVVTDKAINLKKDRHIRELVVPAQYKTKNGTLFKARALQYCLENGVNMLQSSDWIIHLDEETLLTKDSLTGVINFVTEGQHSFGQGVITYANEEIQSWFTTIADTVRVGMDYGIIRFSLSYLHRPYFSWKGSYVVANAGAELKLTWDHGPEGSIAEDCYMAMLAMREGYTFDFIEGDMWEKSTFNVKDFMKQRSRWVQGIFKVFKCREIPWRCKWGLSIMVFAWLTMPFTTSNIFLAGICPIPTPQWLDFLMGFIGSVFMLMYVVGAMKSFNIKRLGITRYVLLLLAPLIIMPLSVLVETVSVINAMYLGLNKNSFYVVKKDTVQLINSNVV